MGSEDHLRSVVLALCLLVPALALSVGVLGPTPKRTCKAVLVGSGRLPAGSADDAWFGFPEIEGCDLDDLIGRLVDPAPPMLTMRRLERTPDRDLPELVAQALLDRALADYDSLNSEEQTIWVVELLNGEIDNGGFVQYFANTRGEHVDDTRRALMTLGASAHLEVFDQAVAVWTAERPVLEPLWATKRGFSESYESSRLSEFDEPWDAAGIQPHESEYIHRNAAAFVR